MRFSHGAQTSYIYFKRIFEKIAFHISFQILSPIRRRSNTILWIFRPLRGVKMIFFPSEYPPPLGFLHYLIWVFFCLKMIFFPFRISASCWISSFSYLGIFVPDYDIFSLQNFYLLLDFYIFFFCLQIIFCPFRISASS